MSIDRDERCATCPVEPGLPCRGQDSHHYCARAETDPVMRGILVRHAHQLAGRQVEAPGLLRRAASFAGAVVQHVATGMHQAPPEVQAERLAICQGCEHHQDGQCRKCGCSDKGLALKVSWAEQRCPADPPRWGPIDHSGEPAMSPLDERSARRSDWLGGRPVRLANGQEWLLPFPAIDWREAEGGEPEIITDPPLDLAALRVLAEASTDPRPLALAFVHPLLLRNYRLSDEQLAALVPLDGAPLAVIRAHAATIAAGLKPGGAARVQALEAMLQGLADRLATIERARP